jgi:hypothetical protein
MILEGPLTSEQCQTIHKQNDGELVWLEMLACNDGRMKLRNKNETLVVWMSAEWDPEEQAQAARLCAAVNGSHFSTANYFSNPLAPHTSER